MALKKKYILVLPICLLLFLLSFFVFRFVKTTTHQESTLKDSGSIQLERPPFLKGRK